MQEKSGHSSHHLDGGETLRLKVCWEQTQVLGYPGSPSLNLDRDG